MFDFRFWPHMVENLSKRSLPKDFAKYMINFLLRGLFWDLEILVKKFFYLFTVNNLYYYGV